MIDIILSIKPRFSNEIHTGRKIVELRKSIGRHFHNSSNIFIYSSSPIKAITGRAIIDKIEVLSVEEIKSKHLLDICISEQELDAYLDKKNHGILIWIKKVVTFEKPITLETLKEYNFTAPQSYCYTPNSIKKILESAI